MRLLKTITALSLITSTFALAQTTMCFKENFSSMSQIESTPLDGGLCSSSKSVIDMKSEGWSVEDINIQKSENGNNFIYIFKKDEPAASATISEEKLEQRILKKLEERKKKEIIVKKQEAIQRMSKSGKKLYISTCQKCHGEKADKKAYNTSRPLVELSLQDMQLSIRDYVIGEYDRGRAILMRPYAKSMTSTDIKNVYSYIKSLKPKEEKKDQEESK
ncbi:cytochrome c [Halarcobacter sp.]|uniref:c-type cytochrome n=1 Tax=Halarcobacter sp. TaxID=2321133 RepID=UPI002AABC63D|nr:cytochrome c [Halarcobacter sp.]